MKSLSTIAAAMILAGCASTPPSARLLNDGDLAIPEDYRSWPRFLADVQRPDAKQVRDIWINPTGAKAKPGEPFPDGTLSVMELHSVKTAADGTVMTGPDGKLVRDKLIKIFIMGKGAGWGAAVPDGLKNGSWVYSAFLADGKTASPEPIAPCRGCHLPLAAKDFVHRYDEYFSKRDTASTGSRY